MIVQNTWPQYLAIRVFILLMRDLGLLCIGYFFVVFALFGVPAITHPVSIIIEAIGLIEGLFYVFFFLPYRIFLQNFKPYKPPPLTRAERAELFYKAAGLIPDPESFIRKWTNNAHLEDVRIDNVKDWLLWALFEIEDIRTIDIETHQELDTYIEHVQQVIGLELKPGRGVAEPLRLSFDPIYMEHRSLAYYLMIGGLDMMMSTWLILTGYKFYRRARSTFFTIFPNRPLTLLSPNVSDAPEMSYWYRPHRSKTHRPVIIVHGLGIGLPPYQFWMATIPKDIGIIAVEMLPIATRITSQVLPPTQVLCDSIATIAAQARREDPASWSDFVLVTSSYGTLLVKKLISHPDFGPRISGNILCDPVALLLHLPDVAFNFTRRTPAKSRRGRPGHANEFEITWASSTDAGTAYSLARRFCWRESVLWREDIMPSTQEAEGGYSRYGDQENQGLSSTSMRTTVIQGGEDCIAPAKNVAAYVFNGETTYNHFDIQAWKGYEWRGTEELELVFLDGRDHGQAMMVPKPSKKIRRVVEGYCNRAVDPQPRPVSLTSLYGKGEPECCNVFINLHNILSAERDYESLRPKYWRRQNRFRELYNFAFPNEPIVGGFMPISGSAEIIRTGDKEQKGLAAVADVLNCKDRYRQDFPARPHAPSFIGENRQINQDPRNVVCRAPSPMRRSSFRGQVNPLNVNSRAAFRAMRLEGPAAGHSGGSKDLDLPIWRYENRGNFTNIRPSVGDYISPATPFRTEVSINMQDFPLEFTQDPRQRLEKADWGQADNGKLMAFQCF